MIPMDEKLLKDLEEMISPKYQGIDAWEISREDALCYYDLIHRLQDENEKLRNAKVIHETVDCCAEDLAKANKEIERLTEELDKEYELRKEYMFAYEKKELELKQLEFEKAELQKQVDELKDERENMQAEILRFEDMKFTQEHCDLYSENETLKQWLKRSNADLEYNKNWSKIQTKQSVKDTAKEALEKFIIRLIDLRLVGVNDDMYYELLEVKDWLLKEYYNVEVE